MKGILFVAFDMPDTAGLMDVVERELMSSAPWSCGKCTYPWQCGRDKPWVSVDW